MTDREAIDVLFNEWKCIDRNDGIHCDRKCESCDLVMDVEIIREAFNKAISALQAQELKQEVKNSKESSSTHIALPSAQPERKKGKWLEMAGDLQCSECGATYYDLYPDYSDTKFCPNCGSYNGGENDQSK